MDNQTEPPNFYHRIHPLLIIVVAIFGIICSILSFYFLRKISRSLLERLLIVIAFFDIFNNVFACTLEAIPEVSAAKGYISPFAKLGIIGCTFVKVILLLYLGISRMRFHRNAIGKAYEKRSVFGLIMTAILCLTLAIVFVACLANSLGKWRPTMIMTLEVVACSMLLGLCCAFVSLLVSIIVDLKQGNTNQHDVSKDRLVLVFTFLAIVCYSPIVITLSLDHSSQLHTQPQMLLMLSFALSNFLLPVIFHLQFRELLRRLCQPAKLQSPCPPSKRALDDAPN
ncbi:hypothetical protein Ciccas_008870 [Cichlidogyrus casuarinus]|uniref:Uncharacterized protein n=1 Tax=Cichlidogyrus casuarinus TaxID=1844966 RepID=A0ABD2Q0B8_9PLAT